MAERRLVLVDANILINLCKVNRLDLLGTLADFDFCSPPEVLAEILNEPGKSLVRDCLGDEHLRELAFSTIAELELFTELRKIMGMGEAACLSLAFHRCALLASDEKRVFRREAEARLGPGRLLNTPGILLLAIRRGILEIDEADELKRHLEARQFKMTFGSFRELLPP